MWTLKTGMRLVRRASFPAALLVVALVAPSRGDTPVYAEGEDYLNYVWHNIGGFDIRIESCSSASQGYAAGGLDVTGEWIMLKAVFPKSGCYDAHVLYQAEYGDTVAFDVKVMDAAAPGGIVTIPFTGEGWGFG
jgi:hypothetical protein